jgi:putative DNA primase/helicase
MNDDPIPFSEFQRHNRTKVEHEQQDPRPPEFSDEAIAQRFAERHAGDLRYVAAWGKWLRWTGAKWQFDDTLHAFDRARAICREAAISCQKEKVATAVASARTVAAIVSLARADRKLAATVEQWDSDPWSLNTPAGTVDLRTSKMRPHRPDDYITKCTAVAPNGDCELWHRFLDRATNGDEGLQCFLQRVIGYSLTGDTSAQALFFGHGTGANGKSVLMDVVAGILGEYHQTAPVETFCATNNDQHPTGLAALRGARLVTANETEEGRRWAESRIKQLTGGDRVAARFMRQDFFEYTPQFKLFIIGNHKPGLRSVDEAIRRRFLLIPFTVTIPLEERDQHLKSKLRTEGPGILAWALRGCLEWQRNGLSPPPIVIEATAVYLEAEDALAAWIEEACDVDAQAWETSAELFASWKAWAEQAGEFGGSTRRFAQAFESRGFPARRTRTARGFEGLKLKAMSNPHQSWSDP